MHGMKVLYRVRICILILLFFVIACDSNEKRMLTFAPQECIVLQKKESLIEKITLDIKKEFSYCCASTSPGLTLNQVISGIKLSLFISSSTESINLWNQSIHQDTVKVLLSARVPQDSSFQEYLISVKDVYVYKVIYNKKSGNEIRIIDFVGRDTSFIKGIFSRPRFIYERLNCQ